MLDYITNFQLNSTLGIYLYWIPAVFCIVFYYLRMIGMYFSDKTNRETAAQNKLTNRKNMEDSQGKHASLSEYYSPNLKLGMIITSSIISFVPIVNIFCAIFDLAPNVFSKFFRYMDGIFNVPLVPADKE